MTVLICHCIRNEHDPRQVLVPDPTCPGCQHRAAAQEAHRAATALGGLLLWTGALLLAAAGITAASLWPGTPWSALGALPGVALLALVLYRALFGRN